MAKKRKQQQIIIQTKTEIVTLTDEKYWTQEAAAMELNTTPGNVRSHVHMHYLGTQVNRMNLLSKDDIEIIRSRLRRKNTT